MKNILLILFVAVATFLGALAYQKPALAINCDNPQSAKEQIQCGACDAAGTTDANNSCDPTTSAGGVGSTVTTVINILSAVGGVAAVIVIVVSGLRYVTSGGKEEGVKNAKNGILHAIIGLVVIALAQLIVHFVLNQTTTATTTNTPPSSSTPGGSGGSGRTGAGTGERPN
jgi:hypothetical protein